MSLLNQIQRKIFKREKIFRKEHSSLNMNFYWQLAVGVVFAVMPLFFFFGYNFFIKISREYIPPVDNTSGQKIIGEERIEKVLEYFSSRKEKSNQIKNSPSQIVDPSL